MPRRYSRRGGEEDSSSDEEKSVDAKAQAPAPPAPAAAPASAAPAAMGGRHRRRHHKTLRPVPRGVHVKAKTLRRLLKSKGLKVSGKKSTLRARARKAHLIRGGEEA